MPILRLLVILLCLSIGCSDEDRPQVVSEDGEGAGEKSAANENEPPKEGFPYKLDLTAKDVSGGWLLYVCENHEQSLQMEVLIQKVPGEEAAKYAVAMRIPNPQEQGPIKIFEEAVTDDTVNVTFGNENIQVNFQGELSGGIIYGNIAFPESIQPAMLVRPGAMLTAPPPPQVAEKAKELSEIFVSGADWDKLLAFAAANPNSTLLPNMYYNLLNRVSSRGMTAEEVEALLAQIDERLAVWGNRYVLMTRLNHMAALANCYYLPELVSKHLEGLKSAQLDSMVVGRMTAAIERLEPLNQHSQRMQDLSSAPADQRAAKLESLRKEEKNYLLDGWYLSRMGRLLESVELPEEALKYYARLCAIPTAEQMLLARESQFAIKGETPTESFKRVWEKVHGSTDGFDAHRLQVYRDYLQELKAETPWETPATTEQAALVEVYTGAQCPPCAAADMAFSVVQEYYHSQPVAFLQYHVHVPGPDPMSNSDSEAQFYRARAPGTPAVLVNRRPIAGVAGGPQQTLAAILQLHREIEAERAQSHGIKINLTAEMTGNQTIRCRGEVQATDGLSDRWRLNLVLAEREVIFRGGNGIPIHEMVVRKVLSTSEGNPPQGKVLALSADVKLTQLKDELTAQITGFEKKHSFKFPSIPMELKDLVLVGFVTDERTERVLQAALLPVK